LGVLVTASDIPYKLIEPGRQPVFRLEKQRRKGFFALLTATAVLHAYHFIFTPPGLTDVVAECLLFLCTLLLVFYYGYLGLTVSLISNLLGIIDQMFRWTTGAGLLEKLTRTSDIVFRYGGDEFAIIKAQAAHKMHHGGWIA
jgi:hypothetical protein